VSTVSKLLSSIIAGEQFTNSGLKVKDHFNLKALKEIAGLKKFHYTLLCSSLPGFKPETT